MLDAEILNSATLNTLPKRIRLEAEIFNLVTYGGCLSFEVSHS
jgi:hypothetical protein